MKVRSDALDHTGLRYGHLVGLRMDGRGNSGELFWLCKCDCGKEVRVRAIILKNRQRFCTKQCPLLGNHARVDFTGQRFGRLVALSFSGRMGGGGKAIWRFICDCGKEVEIPADRAKTGNAHSCGCLGIESRIRHGNSQTREYHREAHKRWSAASRSKVIANANKRRSDYKLRIPAWLTAEHWQQIEAVYAEAARLSQETGISHHVDHIYPIRGKTVSGLHVPANLRAIPSHENLRKSRKMPDDVCWANGN